MTTWRDIGQWFFDFQVLVSGVLAIAAAVITAFVIWRAAKLPMKQQLKQEEAMKRRRQQYAYLVLSTDLQRLAARARQAEGTIRVVIAANANVNDGTREKTRIKFHPIIEDWEFMSLMPERSVVSLMRLQRQVNDHNFDMDRAGGAFGADNFRESILTRIRSIQGLSTALSDQLARLVQPLPQNG